MKENRKSKLKRLKSKLLHLVYNSFFQQFMTFFIVVLIFSFTVRWIETCSPGDDVSVDKVKPVSLTEFIDTFYDNYILKIIDRITASEEDKLADKIADKLVKKLAPKEEAVDDNSSPYDTVLNAIWWGIVTVTTVGYGDISPSSDTGKIVSMFLLLFGVVSFGIISGNIASFLVGRQLQASRGLLKLKKLEDHFIICGWKTEMSGFLSSIFDANPELEPDKVVLINTANLELVESLKAEPRYKGIHYIHGDYVDEEVLKRANIERASKILILVDESDNTSMQEVDSRTVMAVFTVESLTKTIYTCAELWDKKFEKTLKLFHCDEIILSRQYKRTLIANASNATGISHVISKLLSVEEDSGIVVERYPDNFIGQPYSTLVEFFYTKDAILLGILENTGNFFERKKEALREAQKSPDISKLISNLEHVKTMVANEPVINPPKDYILQPHSKAIVINRRKRGSDNA